MIALVFTNFWNGSYKLLFLAHICGNVLSGIAYLVFRSILVGSVVGYLGRRLTRPISFVVFYNP